MNNTRMSNFFDMVNERWHGYNTLVCIGLDSDYSKIPSVVKDKSVDIETGMTNFNCQIIDATADLVCAYKPNMAFYEHNGFEGLRALKHTFEYLHGKYPNIPVILDAKKADISSTNIGYVNAIFNFFEADAVTVHPYLGKEAIQPFLDQKNKGIFVLCRSSNPGAGEFQDLKVRYNGKAIPLYQYVALQVAQKWNMYGNCGLVMGATYPTEIKNVRKLVGDIPFLVPGIGSQSGDLEKTVVAGLDSYKVGLIINSARSIIFSSDKVDFADSARAHTQELRNQINGYRQQ